MQRRNEPLRESVVTEQLVGGGRLCVVPRPSRRCHAVLNIGFGALHEAGVGGGEPPGIAHFLEHRLFEKDHGDISERFTDIGADVDAQTGFTTTSFSVTAGVEVFPQAMELLLELVGTSHFPQDSVTRERTIVGHEIQLYEDSVEWVSFQTLLAALYPDQRIAIDIAGTPESLLAIDAPMLELCHRRRYRADAMHLSACGPIDAGDLVGICDRALGDWPEDQLRRKEPGRSRAQPASLQAPMPLSRPRHTLAFPDEQPRHGLDLMRQELALEMTLDILFGPRSEFFSRHYESGLLDGETFGGEVHLDESYGFCLLGGDTDDPEGLQSAVLDELTEAPGSDWLETDFERARRRVFGDMICRWEDVESTVGFLESASLRGCHPFDATGLYSGEQAVNSEDIRRCLEQCLRPDRVAAATLAG